MLDAIIFDFDGILVDTEPFHFRAFLEILKPEGFDFDWEFYKEKCLGLDDRDVVTSMYELQKRDLTADKLKDLTSRKARLFADLVAQEDVEPYPGVIELLDCLENRFPVGLCSGSVRSDVIPVLKKLGVLSSFDSIVTADDVERSKPDPASYQLIVERLQKHYRDRKIVPEKTLAIEDSPAGIASAKEAGLIVFGITNNYEAKSLSRADRVLDSLLGIEL